MGRIKCSVISCKYNEAGENCKASEIKVENNLGAADMEFGAFENNRDAKMSMETCCETFAPREDDNAGLADK